MRELYDQAISDLDIVEGEMSVVEFADLYELVTSRYDEYRDGVYSLEYLEAKAFEYQNNGHTTKPGCAKFCRSMIGSGYGFKPVMAVQSQMRAVFLGRWRSCLSGRIGSSFTIRLQGFANRALRASGLTGFVYTSSLSGAVGIRIIGVLVDSLTAWVSPCLTPTVRRRVLTERLDKSCWILTECRTLRSRVSVIR